MRRALLCAALAAGCGEAGRPGVGSTGTDVGNPIEVDLAFTAYHLEAGDALVDRAVIHLDRVRLRPAGDCEGGAELELAGPFALDLLAGDGLAGLGVADRAWCRLELSWRRDEASGAAAIQVAGWVGGDRFAIASRRDDALRVEALDPAGFTLEQAGAALFLAFDMAVWLDGVDLAGADRGADGAVAIDDESNRDLLDRFEEAVESASALFADRDGDGALDGDERDDGDALAAGAR